MNDDKKSNKGINKKDIELINRLSEIGYKYNCSAKEVLLKLKEIKNKEVKDE